MNAVCTLGLDLGTSSAKAVVTDTGGRVLAQASAGYAVISAKAGYAESDPGDWWSAVRACACEAVQAAVSAGGAGGARPSAIGLSGQMHGLVLTSADGQALRPALLWADSRATGALRAYRRLGPAALDRADRLVARFRSQLPQHRLRSRERGSATTRATGARADRRRAGDRNAGAGGAGDSLAPRR